MRDQPEHPWGPTQRGETGLSDTYEVKMTLVQVGANRASQEAGPWELVASSFLMQAFLGCIS